MVVNVDKVSLGGVKNILPSSCEVCTTVNILQIIELYTLKWVSFIVCEIYLNKAVKNT